MKLLPLLLLTVASGYAHAAKPCDELKKDIAAKIDAAGVKQYSLEIVDTDKVGNAGKAKVVGACDGGTKRIVYQRK